MAQFTSGLALYKHQVALFNRTGASVRAMHRHMATEGFSDARSLTDGSVGPRGSARRKWLAKNRPFARRAWAARATAAGSPWRATHAGSAMAGTRKAGGLKLTPLPIGVIDGRLYAGWRLTQRNTRFAQVFHLSNRAPYAKHILRDTGTGSMLGRGFQREQRKRWAARNRAFKDHVRAQIRGRN